jgi:hypothetical protein
MLIELFIFFQMLMIGFFITSFYTKQEIFWAITLILSGTLMVSSYNIEIPSYEYDSTISAYAPVLLHYSYPYLMGINMLFFILVLVLGIYDLIDKYGINAMTRDKNNDDEDEFRISNNPIFTDNNNTNKKQGIFKGRY